MINKRSITIGIATLFMSASLLNASPAMADSVVPVTITTDVSDVMSPHIVEGVDIRKLAQRQISPAQAKSIALSRVKGGQYVDLRKVGNYYIVRVRAPGGRVIDIRVDANTGRVN